MTTPNNTPDGKNKSDCCGAELGLRLMQDGMTFDGYDCMKCRKKVNESCYVLSPAPSGMEWKDTKGTHWLNSKEYHREKSHLLDYKKKRQKRQKLQSQTPQRKAQVLAAVKKYQKDNPLKNKARDDVKTAIRIGKIVKKVCAVCSSIDSVAHHHDYSQPLEVIWLCDTHHKEHHKIMRALKDIEETKLSKALSEARADERRKVVEQVRKGIRETAFILEDTDWRDIITSMVVRVLSLPSLYIIKETE